MSDGYYFRDDGGALQGPLTRFQYEAMTLRGEVRPGTRVWREQGGNSYKINIKRRVRLTKVCSPRALGAMAEWVMIASTVFMLIFLASIKKLRDQLYKEMKGEIFTTIFMVLLLAITLTLAFATIRKLSRKVHDTTTDVFESEV